MDQACEDVKKIIQGHREQMEALGQALIKYETLDGDEVRLIVIEGKTLDKPTVIDLLEAEQSRPKTKESPPKEQPQTEPPTNGLTGPIPSPG